MSSSAALSSRQRRRHMICTRIKMRSLVTMVALLILSADIIIQVHGGSFNDRSISLQNLGGGNNLRRYDLSGARRIRRSSSASKMIPSPYSSSSSYSCSYSCFYPSS